MRCAPHRRPGSAIAATTPRASASPASSKRTGTGRRCRRLQVFARGQYPALGRFNLGTPDPNAPDATVRVRGLGLRIATPDGQEWRTAMIDRPVLSGVDAAGLLRAAARVGEQGPGRDEEFRRRASGNRGVRRAGPRARPGPAATRRSAFNSLNSFIFVDSAGAEHAVRWSLLPAAQAGPDHAGRPRQARPRLPGAGDRRAGPRRRRSAGPWW